jgi:hypothetical protein
MMDTLVAHGRPVRVYGEMVDNLAVRGDYAHAILLESMWNALATRYTFTLFCGYSAISFGDPRRGDMLRKICAAHTHVSADDRDPLGAFLVATHG